MHWSLVSQVLKQLFAPALQAKLPQAAAQMPGLVGMLQAWHAPSQPVSQHTPLTQKPE